MPPSNFGNRNENLAEQGRLVARLVQEAAGSNPEVGRALQALVELITDLKKMPV